MLASSEGKKKNDYKNNNAILQQPQKVFKYKCSFSATITDTMKRRGWVEDIFWCDMNQMRDFFTLPVQVLTDHQRIGHFRNCFEVSRKNLMVKNLKNLRARIEKAFGKEEGEKCNFYPTTFILPSEHNSFMMAYRENPDSFWIIKPAAGAQGRGIIIFQKLRDYFDWRAGLETPEPHQSQIIEQQILGKHGRLIDQKDPPADLSFCRRNLSSDDLAALHANNLGLPIPPRTAKSTENLVEPDPTFPSDERRVAESTKSAIHVIQRYIKDPYLIGGRKFDIRLYVLVTSYLPLKVWVYREGFARFSAGKFTLKSLQDVYVHLTNVAIQRTSKDYNPDMGSKWSLRSLREYMTARHGRNEVQDMMNQIDNIIIRTLQSVHQLISQDPHCFEVYGFDVLIDSNLRPWLLEVNASPAFTPSNEEDYRMKSAIIDDTVHVLDLEGRLTGYEKRVGGYDLFWDDGPVYANPNDCGHAKADNGPKLNSFLGCFNQRQEQLRQTFANAKFIREVHTLQTASLNVGNGEAPVQAVFKREDERYRLPAAPIPTHDIIPAFVPLRNSRRILVSGSPRITSTVAPGPYKSPAKASVKPPIKGLIKGPVKPTARASQSTAVAAAEAKKTLRVAGKAVPVKKNTSRK